MTTTPRKRHIGYIGVGAMGGGMAAHLLSNGYPLSVYDVDPEAVDRLVRKGVGSSISSTLGLAIRVRPISTMRCWPPESSPVICLRLSRSTGKRS